MKLIDNRNKKREEEEEQASAPILKLLQGGRPPGDTWIDRIPPRSVILCVPSNDPNGFVAQEWHVVKHREKETLLYSNLGQETYLWVQKQRFCKFFTLSSIVVEGDWKFNVEVSEEEEPKGEAE